MQVFNSQDGSTLFGWSVLIFKISMVSGPICFPFALGAAACAQETRVCHPNQHLPVSTLTFLCSMIFLFNLGLLGIHIKEIMTDPACVTSLAIPIVINFFSFVATTLLTFTWLYDLIVNCPDGDNQEIIEAEVSDSFLHKYECLKSGTEWMFMLMFTFVQISIIFSLYNSLEGKYIRTCMRLC
jgi:hypothetical protein